MEDKNNKDKKQYYSTSTLKPFKPSDSSTLISSKRKHVQKDNKVTEEKTSTAKKTVAKAGKKENKDTAIQSKKKTKTIIHERNLKSNESIESVKDKSVLENKKTKSSKKAKSPDKQTKIKKTTTIIKNDDSSGKKKEKKLIVFVCTGNTCRSPMAEYILKNYFKINHINDYDVISAGISVLEGDVINTKARITLDELGVPIKSHKAKNLTVKDVNSAYKILCMTTMHKESIGSPQNAIALAEIDGLQDVPDPYGGPLEYYLQTARYLQSACDIIYNSIKEN